MRYQSNSLRANGLLKCDLVTSRGVNVSLALVVSLIYASVLVLMPWEVIRGEPFFDLQVYKDSFDFGTYDYLDQLEGLPYLFSEPLWRFIIATLTDYTGHISTTLSIVSFFVSAIYVYVTLRINKYLAFFLLAPLLVNLLVSQVRSAVAGALFLLSLYYANTFVAIFLFIFSFFIHSASLLVFGLFIVSVLLNKFSVRYPNIVKLLAITISIVIPLVFALTYINILDYIGDRRVATEIIRPSGVFILSFSIYYLLMFLNISEIIKSKLMVYSLIVSGMFVVLAIYEINMTRLLALVFPVLIGAALKLSFSYRAIALITLFLMCVYHLVLWL